MTQNILGAMESDEVNSISDTVESLQVAEEIRTTYEYLFSNDVIPMFEGLVKLDGLADLDRPNILKIPENVKHIYWIKYDSRDPDLISVDQDTHTYELEPSTHNLYKDIPWLSPKEFVDRLVKFNSGQGNIITVKNFPDDVLLPIRNDAFPTYWTTFDNEYATFDSFNESVEATMQQSKSLCFGQYTPEFRMEDTFVPQLDPNLFPLLLAEAKASCFVNYKQVSNSKEEQKSHRLMLKSQNDRRRFVQSDNPRDRLPNYGRIPR